MGAFLERAIGPVLKACCVRVQLVVCSDDGAAAVSAVVRCLEGGELSEWARGQGNVVNATQLCSSGGSTCPFCSSIPPPPPRFRPTLPLPLGSRLELHFWNRISHVNYACMPPLHISRTQPLSQVLPGAVFDYLAHDPHSCLCPCPYHCKRNCSGCSSPGSCVIRAAHTSV